MNEVRGVVGVVPKDVPYVLVSAVFNERHRIESIVADVAAQTLLPRRWVIVSDGSTDGTDDLIKGLSHRHTFIVYARQEKRPEDQKRREKVTIAQARAMRAARELCKDIKYAYLGNLDVDVRLPREYYATIIDRMERDPRIGIGGGAAVSIGMNGQRLPGGFVKPYYVGGPIQLFRRQCLEDIDGYAEFGHADAVADAKARMQGWAVQCFTDIEVMHLEQPGYSAREKIPACFGMGQGDYIMGGDPCLQVLRCLARCFKPPYLVAGTAMLAGYLWAWVKRYPVGPDPQLRRFMRAGQWEKLRRRLGFSSA